MKNMDRIWALIGLVLIAASLICMLAGCFLPDARALLMNISLITLAGAGAVLAFLGVKRSRDKQNEADNQQDD